MAAVTCACRSTVAVSSSEVHPSITPPGSTIKVVMLRSFAVHELVVPVRSLTQFCAATRVADNVSTPSRTAHHPPQTPPMERMPC